MLNPKYDCKIMKHEKSNLIRLSEYRRRFRSDYALAKALGKSQTAVKNWLNAGSYINLDEGKIYTATASVKVN